MVFWPGIGVAVALGFMVSCLELLTSKYPNTIGFVLRSSASLYLYGICYGLVAAGADFALDNGILNGAIKLANGQETNSPWWHAILAGVAAKAFMQLNLFTLATSSTTSMPVEIQTISQIFERPLTRRIVSDEYEKVRAFVDPYAKKYQSIALVKSTIKGNTPSGLKSAENQGFDAEVDNATSALEAMELFLRFVGVKVFKRAFPL